MNKRLGSAAVAESVPARNDRRSSEELPLEESILDSRGKSTISLIFPLSFFLLQDLEQNLSQSLPVLMPGDAVPKFIALPCPCEPPKEEKFVPTAQKPPPKLPRVAVPLY